MDTSSSSVSVPAEEKKPDIKKEPKEEDDGTRSTGPNSSTPSGQNKKKGMSEIFHLPLMLAEPLCVGYFTFSPIFYSHFFHCIV